MEFLKQPLGMIRQEKKRNDILFSVWIIALGGLLHLSLSRITPPISKITESFLFSDLHHLSGARWTQRMSRNLRIWDWARQKRSTGLASLSDEHSLTAEHRTEFPLPTVCNFLHCLELPHLPAKWKDFSRSYMDYKYPSINDLGVGWMRSPGPGDWGNWKMLVSISTLESITLSLRKANLSQSNEPFLGVEVCLRPLPLLTRRSLPRSRHIYSSIKWPSEQGAQDLLRVTYLGTNRTRIWIQVFDGHGITLPESAGPRKPQCESEGNFQVEVHGFGRLSWASWKQPRISLTVQQQYLPTVSTFYPSLLALPGHLKDHQSWGFPWIIFSRSHSCIQGAPNNPAVNQIPSCAPTIPRVVLSPQLQWKQPGQEQCLIILITG